MHLANPIPPPETIHKNSRAKTALILLCAFLACSPPLKSQTTADSDNRLGRLAWSTDSTGPRRFISVHGRRAAVFGYSQAGLEVWAYPLQLLTSYSVSFRQPGATTGIDGQSILRRILYNPESLTRIYAGPDFVVKEKIFVPLDEPGAIIYYEVESNSPVDIMIRFIPVLDLMWPAGIGGQEVRWSPADSAWVLFEPTHRFTASLGSPDMVAHDETPNTALPMASAPGLAFTIRAYSQKAARVIIAGSVTGQNASAIAKRLLQQESALEKNATDHYSDLLSHALQIETPDAETNRALAWSEIALDQAWVCNPDLGCGLVAGYGPSRKARRPQYDWFFAGDGMVTIQALLAAGQYERARQELEFILKYQDRKTGMVWHEQSQSAGLLDWTKYPYVFVHVDLTFQFLNTVGKYFSVTGDQGFVGAHWASIQAAFDYCRSILDKKDGLPRIPVDKEGGSEQNALSDDLMLSANWASAAKTFASLARATGRDTDAADAIAASQAAMVAIRQRYWDTRQQLWITGYIRSGAPLIDHDIGPARVMNETLLPAARRDSLLDQIATADFQTDWGTRGKAASAQLYDPNSYSSGSVWATGTAEIANTFWAEHRPATAYPIWSALVSWSSLDSLGHMHEALAGDYYHEELESVPEQTWSSAAFFTTAVNGLLGVRIDSLSNRLTFAPHLPPNWNAITLRNLHVGASEISLNMVQSTNEIHIQMQNEGPPVEVAFDPELPLGAKLLSAHLGRQSISAGLEEHPQDTHAKVEFTLPRGKTLLSIGYKGGVAIVSDPTQLMIGDSGKAIKITGVSLKDRVYTIDIDYLPAAVSSFELRTPWTIQDAQGATLETVSPNLYRLTVSLPAQATKAGVYQHAKVFVTFAGTHTS